jgi:hypothetical protein
MECVFVTHEKCQRRARGCLGIGCVIWRKADGRKGHVRSPLQRGNTICTEKITALIAVGHFACGVFSLTVRRVEPSIIRTSHVCLMNVFLFFRSGDWSLLVCGLTFFWIRP